MREQRCSVFCFTSTKFMYAHAGQPRKCRQTFGTITNPFTYFQQSIYLLLTVRLTRTLTLLFTLMFINIILGFYCSILSFYCYSMTYTFLKKMYKKPEYILCTSILIVVSYRLQDCLLGDVSTFVHCQNVTLWHFPNVTWRGSTVHASKDYTIFWWIK